MRWIREHKIFVVSFFIIALLIIMILIAFNSGNSSISKGTSRIMTTVEKPFVYIANSIKNAGKGIFKYGELLDENEKLKAENTKLKLELEKNSISKDELSRLEQFYQLFKSEPLNNVEHFNVADIIAIDNSSVYKEFTVNTGSSSGIQEGDFVIDTRGVVGRVSQVTEDSSKISTVLSGDISLSFVAKKNTDIIGVIKGDGSNILKGYLLDEKASVSEGDIILTSGRGNIAKGIPIGSISKTYYDNNTKLRIVEIKPTVEFYSMQKVAIIR